MVDIEDNANGEIDLKEIISIGQKLSVLGLVRNVHCNWRQMNAPPPLSASFIKVKWDFQFVPFERKWTERKAFLQMKEERREYFIAKNTLTKENKTKRFRQESEVWIDFYSTGNIFRWIVMSCFCFWFTPNQYEWMKKKQHRWQIELKLSTGKHEEHISDQKEKKHRPKENLC